MNQCPCCAFAQTARTIEGLKDFEPRRLPAWLRDRLFGWSPSSTDNEIEDQELVEYEIEERGERNLMGWGRATFAGQPVFVFGAELSFELIELATALNCGFLRVEQDDSLDEHETMVILTEHPVRRRTLDADAEDQRVLGEIDSDRLCGVG